MNGSEITTIVDAGLDNAGLLTDALAITYIYMYIICIVNQCLHPLGKRWDRTDTVRL